MVDGIGGYFELELRKGKEYHSQAIALNTARNCFEYILRSRQYRKVFIPYYTCEVMLEPLTKCGVDYEFYHIDDSLEPVKDFNLKKGEAFIYTNYYGLKQNEVKRLAALYGDRLIVDNAQAFFADPIGGIDTFYSARKFFGVADGAYLYTEKSLDVSWEIDQSYDRMMHLLKRADVGSSFGYEDFQKNENLLINQDIRLMSNLTHKILASIDYEEVKKTRQNNYDYLDRFLKTLNGLELKRDEDSVPMCYPFLSGDFSLRERLITKKVFVAKYWPNVQDWVDKCSLEYLYTQNLIPLPVDQRYSKLTQSFINKILD